METAYYSQRFVMSVCLAASLALVIASPSIAGDADAKLVGPWKITSSKHTENGVPKGECSLLTTKKILKLRSDGSGEILSGKGVVESVVDAAIPTKFRWRYNADEREIKLSNGATGNYKVRFVEEKVRLSTSFTNLFGESVVDEIILTPDD